MIVPMKKVTLHALRQEKDELLLALQHCGELMVVSTTDSAPQDGFLEATDTLKRTEATLRFVERSLGKRRMLEPRPEVETETLLSVSPDFEKVEHQAHEIERALAENASKKSAILAELASLKSWLPLDAPVEQLKNTKKVAIFTGSLPESALPGLTAAADELDCAVQPLGDGPEGRIVVLYAPHDRVDELQDAAKNAGLAPATPPRITGLPKDHAARLESKIQELDEGHKSLANTLADLGKQRDELEILLDQQATDRARKEAESADTDYTFRLEGWVVAKKEDKVKKAVESVTDAYVLSFEEPTEEDTPPTVTKNNKFTTPFETITDMFSRPDAREVDPNPVLAPWYWMIFGMMMADVGYGLMLALGTGLFLKLKKPRGEFAKLIKVLLYSSITTAFWGVMFGSYFGASWFPPVLWAPIDEPVSTLLLCMVLGALHIFCGIGLSMVNCIRNKDWAGAIFDNLSWIILLTGLGFMFVPGLDQAGTIMALSGAAIVLFTSARANKGIKKITGGILNLYGVTGQLSDILSYSRILALALSSGVVAFVFNLLAGMLQGSVIGFAMSILIYLIGHLFNLAMGLLSAYVHASRLQYIEFFGKFYQGNGRAFTPMRVEPRHVDVK